MRLIDADAVKFEVEYGYDNHGVLLVPYRDIKKSMEATKTVDAVQVVHGRWNRMDGYTMRLLCSECGWDVSGYGKFYRYCPNCGSKMDGGGEDG